MRILSNAHMGADGTKGSNQTDDLMRATLEERVHVVALQTGALDGQQSVVALQSNTTLDVRGVSDSPTPNEKVSNMINGMIDEGRGVWQVAKRYMGGVRDSSTLTDTPMRAHTKPRPHSNVPRADNQGFRGCCNARSSSLVREIVKKSERRHVSVTILSI